MISYRDFKKYLDYLQGGPAFSWLPEFDGYVSEKYGVRLMPAFYAETQTAGKVYLQRFHIVPYSDEDYEKLKSFMEGGNPQDYIVNYRREFRKILDIFISRYDTPKIKEGAIVAPVLERSYLWHYTFNYLLSYKMQEIRGELERYFDYLKPYRLSFGSVCVCILETREQAAQFYHSPEYKELPQKLYAELKKHDQYDVLLPGNIHIFTDYKEHYNSMSMFVRWVGDMNYAEMKEYMDSL